MTVQLELWQIIGLVITLGGAFLGVMRWIALDQRRAITERLDGMESSRREATQHWNEQFAALLGQLKTESDGRRALERDFLKFQSELPVKFVFREDYVRGQSVIEVKLDALYNKLEVVQIQGARNGND